MPDEVKLLLTFSVSLFAALFVMPKLSLIANRIGLVDRPNERKMHKEPRPLVGGIGIVVSATFAALIFVPLGGLRGYFSGLAVLLVVGFFDDFMEVGHIKKFLGQILATSLLFSLSNVYLFDFGNLLGLGDIVVPDIPWLVWFVTVFCVVGVTNAVNMIDGLDGLAGGVSFIVFLTFTVLAALIGNRGVMFLNVALAGAVLGFLRFNWKPAKLFMGDAGSLCLGFTLSFMAVALTQSTMSTVAPVVVLIVLTVPISDTITVMTRRIIEGSSPFYPDRTHLHHTLIDSGFTETASVLVVLALCLFFSGVGIVGVLYSLPEPLLFTLFLCYFLGNYYSRRWIPKITLRRKRK